MPRKKGGYLRELAAKMREKKRIICSAPNENDRNFAVTNNTQEEQEAVTIQEISVLEDTIPEHVESPVEELPTIDIQITESEPKAYQIEGRRIINLQNFYSRLQEISTHGPLNCGLSSLEIIYEKQFGYQSTFTFQCKLCSMKFYISSDEGSEMNINNCAVLGTVAIGCGHSQLQELSASLELPTMSPILYQKCHQKIADMWEAISIKTINDAAKTEREIAISQGRVDDNGIPTIDVIVDGCWSKRTYKKNYSALSGAAVIIGKKTGKILYIGVKNKYCCICAHAEFKKETPKEHKCFKNYSGPSTGMESAILVEGFRCSIDMHGLIYERMISDGDSATYAKLIETRPYSNTTVQKIECKNHIMRNLCNKLSQLKTDTKYPVRYRKNITAQKIIAIRIVIKRAIQKYTSESESEKRVNVEPLYNDILLAHLHAFGDHSRCKEYFCKKTDETSDHDFRTSSLWGKICNIMSYVASHAPSLVHNVESNKAENYNSIIAKLVGGKRINYGLKGSYQNRCKGAAISFNTSALLSTTYIHATGKNPTRTIKQLETRRLFKKQKSTKKSIRKKNRYLHNKGEDFNYGENCTREDITSEMMEQEKITFINNLKKTEEERQNIERLTVLQSSSSEWLELRRKLLTASNFGRVIKRRADVSCSNLVKDLLYKDSISHVKSIKHGRDCEKIAIDQIAKETGINIEPCGLFIDEELPYLGASPDGLCTDMIVEIKCPVSAYQIDFSTAVKKKKIPFYRSDTAGEIKINTNHNWYFQIQGQLHITKRSKCLFGLWLGENFPVKIEMIEKDDLFWNEVMKNKLIRFYIDCVLPELIDPRHPRKMEIRDPIYIQKAIEEKACKNKLSRNGKKNAIKENIEEEQKEIERKIEDKENKKDVYKKIETTNNNHKEKIEEKGSEKVNFSNILEQDNCEISDDEVPYKRKKIMTERKLNFSEF